MATDKQKGELRKMRYSDEEMALIKATFADNDDILVSIRRHFLQSRLTAHDKATLSALKGDALTVFSKHMLPEIDDTAPIGQITDLFMNLTAEVKDKDPEDAYPIILSKHKFVRYVSDALEALGGKDRKTGISFGGLLELGGKTKEEAYVDTLTRNAILAHVESMLIHVKTLAGLKEETVEKTKTRLFKNSAR